MWLDDDTGCRLNVFGQCCYLRGKGEWASVWISTRSSVMNQSFQKIFISHANEDGPRIEGLVEMLRGLGHRAFVASDSILPGRDWQDQIVAELDACDAVVVVWSRAASRSTWVEREYSLALEQDPHRPVIPVCIDETELPGALSRRQAAMLPLVDGLLSSVRRLRLEGASEAEIRASVEGFLVRNDVRLSPDSRGRVVAFAAGTGVGLGGGAVSGAAVGWMMSPALAKVVVVVAVGVGGVGAGTMLLKGESAPGPVGVRRSAVPSEGGPSGSMMEAPISPAATLDVPESVVVCPNGISIDFRARRRPGDQTWDLGTKVDMGGNIVVGGRSERIAVRQDRERFTASFFVGREVRVEGEIEIHVYDRDLKFDERMASKTVPFPPLFSSEWTRVEHVDVRARCRD